MKRKPEQNITFFKLLFVREKNVKDYSFSQEKNEKEEGEIDSIKVVKSKVDDVKQLSSINDQRNDSCDDTSNGTCCYIAEWIGTMNDLRNLFFVDSWIYKLAKDEIQSVQQFSKIFQNTDPKFYSLEKFNHKVRKKDSDETTTSFSSSSYFSNDPTSKTNRNNDKCDDDIGYCDEINENNENYKKFIITVTEEYNDRTVQNVVNYMNGFSSSKDGILSDNEMISSVLFAQYLGLSYVEY